MVFWHSESGQLLDVAKLMIEYALEANAFIFIGANLGVLEGKMLNMLNILGVRQFKKKSPELPNPYRLFPDLS